MRETDKRIVKQIDYVKCTILNFFKLSIRKDSLDASSTENMFLHYEVESNETVR